MTLIDDLKDHDAVTAPERRRFLALLGSGALAAVGLASTVATWEFLIPRVVYEEDKRIALGHPDDFAEGSVLVLRRQGIFVARTAHGFVALSSTCTHLGCIINYDPAQSGFACPCHGSRFHADGMVLQGPAKSPLRRFAMKLERGLLVVDAGQTVAADFVFAVPV